MKNLAFAIFFLLFVLSTVSGQTGGFKATVTSSEARFEFPIDPNYEYSWNSGGLTYAWNVKTASPKCEIGFFLYTAHGAGVTEEGDINKVLEAGQFSAFCGGRVRNDIQVSGFANAAKDRLTVVLAGEKSIRLLFGTKPKYLIFQRVLELFEKPRVSRVAVNYAKGPTTDEVNPSVGKTFLMHRECGWGAGAGCKAEMVTFRYTKSDDVSVYIGDTGCSPSVTISTNGNSLEYVIHLDPTPHFIKHNGEECVEEHSDVEKNVVDSNLGKTLLDIHRLGEEIAFSDFKVSTKRFSETGKYLALIELRRALAGQNRDAGLSPLIRESPREKIVDGGELNGKATSLPIPKWPKLHSPGTTVVIIEVVIAEEGKVESARALSGPKELYDAAVEAAYGSRFSPTLLSGQPVKVKGTIRYNFVGEKPVQPIARSRTHNEVSTANRLWSGFWAKFVSAVNRKDFNALVGLSASDDIFFDGGGGGTSMDWFKMVEPQWNDLRNDLARGTLRQQVYKQDDGTVTIERATRKHQMRFSFENGRWLFIGVMGD